MTRKTVFKLISRIPGKKDIVRNVRWWTGNVEVVSPNSGIGVKVTGDVDEIIECFDIEISLPHNEKHVLMVRYNIKDRKYKILSKEYDTLRSNY